MQVLGAQGDALIDRRQRIGRTPVRHQHLGLGQIGIAHGWIIFERISEIAQGAGAITHRITDDAAIERDLGPVIHVRIAHRDIAMLQSIAQIDAVACRVIALKRRIGAVDHFHIIGRPVRVRRARAHQGIGRCRAQG